jgi:hypothetical protein
MRSDERGRAIEPAPSPHTLVCAIRDHELLPPVEQHYIEIRGWEKPGRGLHGRSGSSLVLREPTGRIACSDCISALQQGIDPSQITIEAGS